MPLSSLELETWFNVTAHFLPKGTLGVKSRLDWAKMSEDKLSILTGKLYLAHVCELSMSYPFTDTINSFQFGTSLYKILNPSVNFFLLTKFVQSSFHNIFYF